MSCLIFNSSRHFEFMFVCGVRRCSNSTDLHAAVQFYHHFLKRLSLLIICSCFLCQSLIDEKLWFISGLSSVPLIHMCQKLDILKSIIWQFWKSDPGSLPVTWGLFFHLFVVVVGSSPSLPFLQRMYSSVYVATEISAQFA